VYMAPDIRFFFVPLAVLPLMWAGWIMFRKRAGVIVSLVSLILSAVILAGMFAEVGRVFAPVITRLSAHPALAVGTIVAGSWLLFAGVLWYVCLRGSLVRRA